MDGSGHDPEIHAGVKKPQAAQQQADVMAGTTQHSVERIAERALEPVASKFPICLHVSQRWFDGAAAFDHGLDAAGDPPALARAQDAHTVYLNASVSTVNDRCVDRGIGQDGGLFQGFVQRVAVVGVARHRPRPHHEAFFQRSCHRHLHAELIGRARLAF